jgi:hypothetical protein
MQGVAAAPKVNWCQMVPRGRPALSGCYFFLVIHQYDPAKNNAAPATPRPRPKHRRDATKNTIMEAVQANDFKLPVPYTTCGHTYAIPVWKVSKCPAAAAKFFLVLGVVKSPLMLSNSIKMYRAAGYLIAVGLSISDGVYLVTLRGYLLPNLLDIRSLIRWVIR